MTAPTNPNEWWELLDNHWGDILQCFENVGAPMDDNVWSDGIGKEAIPHDYSLLVTLEKLKESRDPKMARMLYLCWLAAPDKPYIHEWKSWGVLCDLCSEEWCLDPEQVAEYQREISK